MFWGENIEKWKGRQPPGAKHRTPLAWVASALPLSHDSRTTTNPHNPLYVLHIYIPLLCIAIGIVICKPWCAWGCEGVCEGVRVCVRVWGCVWGCVCVAGRFHLCHWNHCTLLVQEPTKVTEMHICTHWNRIPLNYWLIETLDYCPDNVHHINSSPHPWMQCRGNASSRDVEMQVLSKQHVVANIPSVPRRSYKGSLIGLQSN